MTDHRATGSHIWRMPKEPPRYGMDLFPYLIAIIAAASCFVVWP